MSTFDISKVLGTATNESTIEDSFISEASQDALFEQMLIEECSRFDDNQMKMFLESDLCQQLITEGKMRKNTIVILSKKDDHARRRKMVAMQMAKDNNDPLWEKLKKNRVIERQLLGKIMKKYGNKADRTAKVQQKDWIKNRMPANFGKFGGDTRISHDAPAK